jgi:hypothetical protein
MKITKSIIVSGIVAGILDATAAMLLFAKPVNLHNISRIFRFIARGLFGEAANTTGALYPALGLVLHFVISIAWAAIYFYIFFKSFKQGFILVKIILFAALIWIGMNGFVIPLSGLGAIKSDGWAIMRSFAILLICVSLPICLIAEKKVKN